ncbi:nucleoporin SEH1-like [Antedon mediterranea]|uniref:nucleoporin SEH1-like n=1 Tax=Antedon mediterranea TaxID=105859 RepID=UPI003AF58BA8
MEAPLCPIKSISAEHKDLIHDVAFDFYGKRMATCSSDQSLKVWDLGEDGEWQCTANWRSHGGSVWRVTWCHPEFGQVLASCSFDRTTAIWEEIVGDSTSKQKSQGHWVKRTTFVDSRTSITDVKFAPKHLGLQVATCSTDGIVRFYEASDVMNLTVWSSVQEEINTKMSKCSCISWNPSRIHSPMVAVGSNDPNPSGGGKVLLFEYSQSERKWNKVETLMTITEGVHDVAFAPNLGRSYHTLAVASKDVKITTLKPLRSEHTGTMPGPTRLEMCQSGLLDHQNRQVWRISWNITGTILASSSDDGLVRLWKANYLENWKCIQTLKGDGQYMKPF